MEKQKQQQEPSECVARFISYMLEKIYEQHQVAAEPRPLYSHELVVGNEYFQVVGRAYEQKVSKTTLLSDVEILDEIDKRRLTFSPYLGCIGGTMSVSNIMIDEDVDYALTFEESRRETMWMHLFFAAVPEIW